MPSTGAFRWSPDDLALVCQLELTHSHTAIGQRYGLSRQAVTSRLVRYRRRTGYTKPQTHLMTPQQVSDALGCSHYTIRRWQRRGVLAFTQRTIGGRLACTFQEVIAFLERGYALCLCIHPPATSLYWRGEVARIRADLRCRLVEQHALSAALGVTIAAVYDWRRLGFPRPVVNLGIYGAWVERQAVIAWLEQ